MRSTGALHARCRFRRSVFEVESLILARLPIRFLCTED